MSTENNITFEDSKFKIKSRAIFGRPEVPNIIKFLVNKKIVKNEKQAAVFMFILLIAMIISSVLIVRSSVSIDPALPSPDLIFKK